MSLGKGIYIRLIKGFKFPEPVFYPKLIKNNLRFLTDPQEMKKRIDLMGKHPWEKIQNFGALKPIRNPRIRYDEFWEPFQHSINQESGFRMYPFQIVPLPSEQIKTYIQKTLFEDTFNTEFRSIYSQYQIRLYSPGVGTVHLIIHLELPHYCNIEKILNIVLKRRWINSSFLVINDSLRKRNFPGWAEHMYTRLLEQISEHREESREIPGYIAVINLQGDFPVPEVRKILEKFGTRKEGNSAFMEKNYDDIIYLHKNLLFLYVDRALFTRRMSRYLEKPIFILHGRRCIRGHLLNAFELGYSSAYLLRFYYNVVNGLFGKPQNLKWIPTLKKIVNIPSYLKFEQWKRVYACELHEQGIMKEFVDTLQNSLQQNFSEQHDIGGIITNLATLGTLLLVATEIYGKLRS